MKYLASIQPSRPHPWSAPFNPGITHNTVVANFTLFADISPYFSGGSFSSSQAFYGRMSRVNIWSHVLANDAIVKMSLGCGLVSGDVVAWHHFKNNLFGDVQVETPSWCSLIGMVNSRGVFLLTSDRSSKRASIISVFLGGLYILDKTVVV